MATLKLTPWQKLLASVDDIVDRVDDSRAKYGVDPAHDDLKDFMDGFEFGIDMRAPCPPVSCGNSRNFFAGYAEGAAVRRSMDKVASEARKKLLRMAH